MKEIKEFINVKTFKFMFSKYKSRQLKEIFKNEMIQDLKNKFGISSNPFDRSSILCWRSLQQFKIYLYPKLMFSNQSILYRLLSGFNTSSFFWIKLWTTEYF